MKIQSQHMQYPNVLSLIDAELDRLQRARDLLLSAPLINIPAQPVRPKVARSVRVQPSVPPTPAPDTAPFKKPLADSLADSLVPIEVEGVVGVRPAVTVVAEAETHNVAKPSAMPVKVAAKKTQGKNVLRTKKQMRGEPSALRSAAPVLPVAVSAMEAQRQRLQIQEARGASAAKAARLPELSAEMLAQRWLRKGNADSRSA